MTLEEDKLNAFNKTLRGALEQIKNIVMKTPDKNTSTVVYVVKQALYFTS